MDHHENTTGEWQKYGNPRRGGAKMNIFFFPSLTKFFFIIRTSVASRVFHDIISFQPLVQLLHSFLPFSNSWNTKETDPEGIVSG